MRFFRVSSRVNPSPLSEKHTMPQCFHSSPIQPTDRPTLLSFGVLSPLEEGLKWKKEERTVKPFATEAESSSTSVSSTSAGAVARSAILGRRGDGSGGGCEDDDNDDEEDDDEEEAQKEVEEEETGEEKALEEEEEERGEERCGAAVRVLSLIVLGSPSGEN